MFPKLYNKNETDFLHNGLGLLSDAIKVVAREEINGLFELKMEYDSEGFLVDEIKEEMIIKAKANDKQDEQLFRIYSITKNHENDNLIIDAQHITYDLSNNFIEELPAERMTKKQVMELIGSSTIYPHPFNVTSSNVTTRSSTSLYRTNPLQMIAGMEGSVLQIWGGQIERDNFNLIMHDRRGSDDGVLVTYKKNLTGLNAKFDISNLVTRIFPFKYIPATDDEPEQLITVPGGYIDSPHIDDYEMPYIMPLDLSHEMDIETSDDLLNASQNWFVETGRDRPKVEMEVKFEHLWETEEYKDLAALELVGMGDTITVKHSKLKVEGTSIVNCIEYDVLAQKNIAVDVGNVKASFTDKVNDVSNIVDKVDELESSTNQALKTANGKNTIYYGPDEPTGNHTEGDLWFRVVDGEYTRTYRYDGIQWQLIMSKDIADIEETANTAKNRANESVEKAELATSNANEAIDQAQGAFDKAQESLEGLDTLVSITNEHGEELTTIKGGIEGLQASVTDAEGNIASLQATSESFATRIEDAEGNISSISQTAEGLQRRMSDAEGNISSVTELATGMQTRLTNAEGDINTLTQTASSLESTITGVRDDLDGLEFENRNLLLDTSDEEQSFNFSGWSQRVGYVSDYGLEELSGGGTFTVSIDITTHTAGSTTLGLILQVYREDNTFQQYQAQSTWLDPLETGRIVSTFNNVAKGDWVRGQLMIRHPSGDAPRSTGTYRGGKLEKGERATPHSIAPEDTQSQITQLADNINLRVKVGDVINQINISDEEILISGNRLILDGDTTVTGTFRVENANITSIVADKLIGGTADFAQFNAININASSITSGTIDTNLLTVRGGSGNEYSLIDGNKIEARGQYTRTWFGETKTVDAAFRVLNGHIRFENFTENKRLYYSDRGISTFIHGYNDEDPNAEYHGSGVIEFFSHMYDSDVRGLTLFSNRGTIGLRTETRDIVLDSARDIEVRTGGLFNIYSDILRAPSIAVREPNTNFYIGVSGERDGELRVTNKEFRNQGDTRYMDVRANNYHGRSVIDTGSGSILYLGSDLGVRITSKSTNEGSSISYRDLWAREMLADSIRKNTGHGGTNFVLGTSSGELRVTNNSLWGGSHASTVYRNVRASGFTQASSRIYKTDIEPLGNVALDIINELTVVNYRLKDDPEELQVGFISEDSQSIATIDEMAINTYKLTSYNAKAIQELDTKIDDEVSALREENEKLVIKVAKLESKLNKLESVA